MPMPSPHDLGVIDLMLGIPEPGQKERWYDFLKPNLRDDESKGMAFPAEYMFKEVPDDPTEGDVIAFTLDQMDAVGIDKALIGFGVEEGIQYRAIQSHPDRFLASIAVDPNEGMKAINRTATPYDLNKPPDQNGPPRRTETSAYRSQPLTDMGANQ